MKPKIICIVGPTAVGKSEVAIELAKKINGEILSADSMQVYKGMDIGTAKLSREQQQEIPHHLIDILDITQDYSVVEFSRMGREILKEILSRDKTPIVVGGSGLYVRSLIHGIFEGPEADWDLREKLHSEETKLGPYTLYQKLQTIDPEAAYAIDKNDLRRIIRALEVFEITNKPISELQKNVESLSSIYDVYTCCLTMERAQLYMRINQRVKNMMENGFLEEVKILIHKQMSSTSSQALGYRELMQYLRGELDLEEAIESIMKHTRRFAKRQLTWFRKEENVEWIIRTLDDTAFEIAMKIYQNIYKENNK